MTMAKIDQTTNSLAIDDTVLFVNTNTNRVGINQGNPSVALHVVGSTTIDSGNLVLSTGDLTITAGSANIGGQTIIKATDPVSLLTNDLAFISTVAVDGVTVTGDGTVGDPLVANIGGGNTLNDTYYRFETSTALTPGSGKVQFNNATFSSVTKIGFNRVNKNGVDIGVILNAFVDASYQVYFQQKDDSSKAVLFNITSGATLVGDVYQFDVSHLQTTTQMSNGKDCFVLFAYREDSTNGTVTSVATTAPLTGGTITTTGTLGITQSGAGADGYLSSADWNTFNSKQPAGAYLTAVAVDGVTITGDGAGVPLSAVVGGIAIGDAVGSGTAGSLLFVDASTNLGQDNSNLFWDDANNRLGIGTQSPSWTLEVNGGNANQIAVFRSTDGTARVNFSDSSTTSDTHVGIGAVGNDIRLWANNQIVFSGASSGNVNFNSGKLATYNGASPLDGQLLIGNSGGAWEAATLTAGTNITITNAGGSITIDAAGGGGATPGGNPGDVQVNDGLGGFGAAAALQDIAYLQPGQAETDTFTPVVSAPSWGPPGPPATIQDAIDRLASFVAGNLGPIP